MTKAKPIEILRAATRKGVTVCGLRYSSEALERLYDLGEKSVRVMIDDPTDVKKILVWHPHRQLWMKVPMVQFERLASEIEINEIAHKFYARASR